MDPTVQQAMDKMNDLRDELRREVEAMRKSLANMSRWVRPGVDELLNEGHKWESWYAWRPVKDIHGSWHWLDNVYRLRGNTYVDANDWPWYHYGTVFDVLKVNQ